MLSALLVTVVAGGAAADEPRPSPEVEAYEVASGCPKRDAFERDVQRRLRHHDDAGTPVRFVVRITGSEATGYSGRLVVHRAAREWTERAVDARTCIEVTSALALAAALALDAERSAQAADEVPARVEPAPSAPSSTPGAAETAPARDTPPPVTLVPSTPAPTSSLEGSVGLHAGASGGVVSTTLFVVPVFAEVRWSPASPDGAWALRWAPSARIGFVRAQTNIDAAAVGAATFRLTHGWLDACPFSIERVGHRITPCARIEAGELEGRGERVEPVRTESRPWIALGLPARWRFSALRWLFLELEAAVRFALRRDPFVLQGDIVVSRANAVGWSASGGAGVAFP